MSPCARQVRFPLAGLLVVAAMAAAGPGAHAAVLRVGPGEAFDRPSAAAAVAAAGDTVLIAPGTYFDCAVWRADRLAIIAPAGQVVLTDTTCQGKAAFVIEGDQVTIRGLGFARARVPDGNGAGIRAEGGALRVEASAFDDNEVGILAAGGTTLVVSGCRFSRNGAGEAGVGRRGADIVATGLGLLHVEGSSFADPHGRAAIQAQATRAALLRNRFAAGPAPAIVLLYGGAAEITANRVVLAGPDGPPFLWLDDDGASAAERVVADNILDNRGPRGALLVRDWGARPAVLSDNDVRVGDRVVSRAGLTWHRMRRGTAHVLAAAKDAFHLLRHALAQLVRAWSA